MTDADVLDVLDVLTEVVTPALFCDENLCSLVLCHMVNLSLEHGNCDASCFAYPCLAGFERPPNAEGGPVRNRPAGLHFIRTDASMRVTMLTMSHSSEVVAKALNDIDDGRPVSNSDAMYLRFIAAPDEVTLLVPEIAKRILKRETEPPTRSKAAGCG